MGEASPERLNPPPRMESRRARRSQSGARGGGFKRARVGGARGPILRPRTYLLEFEEPRDLVLGLGARREDCYGFRHGRLMVLGRLWQGSLSGLGGQSPRGIRVFSCFSNIT